MNDIDEAIQARSERFKGRGTVSWKTLGGQQEQAVAGPALLDMQLFEAQQFRTGNHYPRQRNYHGWYYFSQTGKHVWHESLLESKSLRSLDMFTAVDAIAAQPFRIDFADGFTHFPDYLALHSDGRQVLYDVKPSAHITDSVLDQFARTFALCKQVGWGYSILTELSPQEQTNITFISHFKHPLFHPGAEAVTRLLKRLDQPSSFLDAARALQIGALPNARASLLHLLWRGTVRTDTSVRLCDDSVVERTSDASER